MAEAASERHRDHKALLGELKTESDKGRIWRTGNGSPHRGAEARITVLEEGAVMRTDMDAIAAKVVGAYLKSFRGILQTAAPYVLLLAGIVYAAITGTQPPGAP